MAAVALTIGGLLAFVIVLLAVPLTVVFSIRRIEKTEGSVRFRWLFGLVRFQLRIPRPAKACAEPEPAPHKKPKPHRRKKKRARAGEVVSLIRQPEIRKCVYGFARDMLRATHAQDLLLRLRIGLGDPADTGRLWAIVGPVAGMAQNLRVARLRIEPEFMDPVFEVESHGRFRLVPIQFIVLAAAFALSPTMLRVWPRLLRWRA